MPPQNLLVVFMCDMGGMTVSDYAYFIGMLGLVCGFVFCLGLNK